MARDQSIKKVLVIGSGPIIIGQAAEFDYAGTQACRALKEEGVEVILINSNPATIMTDKDIADKVYIEPLTVPVVKHLIEVEKPDSILPTLGGQNALNIAMALADEGFLEKHHVRTIGTSTDTIKLAEDRLEFKTLMENINEPCAASIVVNHVDDALEFAEKIGYPVVVRPAYTLGGTGGGIANNEKELHDICSNGLRLSRVSQCLIERCIAGWKEIEYEVMRDSAGNCITVCNMENLDPVGVHTGDSIVVAPSQTLSDKEYQMLRSSALNIITALNIEGGCNVQYALNPNSFEYCVIEVNPRVSRSSALASKATGYPIAKLAAKIALGYTLDEIVNAVTGKTYASYEPTLDYIVCKIPKWPFDKFVGASRELGTQMKATGEVMSICNNFEGALMKAIRSLEQNIYDLHIPEVDGLPHDQLRDKLKNVDDHRLFVVAEALRNGISEQEIHDITKIDQWFIDKIKHLVEVENKIKTQELTIDLLKEAKRLEFPDRVIADYTNKSEQDVHQMRKDHDIVAVYKTVDTCAAEFDASTPYYYSVHGGYNEVDPQDEKKKIMVLGSGPIRIGQGIEFDYCSVHCVWALKEAGYDTIIVNNNPETVSTDFDIADRLYFEPLTPEDVESIVDIEKPDGAIVQFGGQTAIKLTKALMEMGVKILGTSADDVDAAEDRERFDEILEKCHIDRPRGSTVFTTEEAIETAHRLGYPVLVRPSYVLGGAGMEIALNDGDIKKFMKIINRQYQEHPILIDKYLAGKEVEVDAICDENGVLIPGIMEHVERAGVHSGDSISVYPTQKIKPEIKQIIVDYTERLAKALHVIGLINIQFIVYEDQVYVIEVNPRSSRTIPYISKVTDIPVVDVATHVIMGKTIKEQGYEYGLAPEKETVAIKMPVFSFEKIKGAEISLGPEMKSTGEVLGISKDFDEAIYKAFMGTGINLPKKKNIICTIKDSAKEEFLPIAKQYYMFGYDLYATEGTYNFLKEHDIPVSKINRIADKTNTIFDLMLTDTVDLIIDIPTRNDNLKDGFVIRRFAVEAGIPIYTSLDTAQALINCLEKRHKGQTSLVDITKLK
ncbi:carbamoyl-phosphate synthase large subunit [Erysipelatoclostridium sp. AM42-17]|uniref:carbamoyl-phosphate synthase large subunit n=1 Tax=Erysipelatoclostridium sp. AM42-17 TaxID=2293102 RepID=UPI000E54C36A|nr:carbamoyl-phosphate synthase large subunit [Erysipelatoclostridium sp. AM42-17]RHS91385.1 carbamoyl-phosphate synthase large subunit [Erysipelatoclostridium sp. AM42-17]